MRILWLKSELLHPIDKGGKIRTYHMLRELKKEHHITYLTLDDQVGGPQVIAQAEEYCHKLMCVPHQMNDKFTLGFYADLLSSTASPLPYTLMKYRSTAMRQEINHQCASGNFDIVVSDFLTPWVNMEKHLEIPKLLFQHNVEAMIWKRYIDVEKNVLKKLFFYTQWRKMQSAERSACHSFDKIVAVSKEDAYLMQRDYAVEDIDDVPTGVDIAYFTPDPQSKCETCNLVFVGSMDWLPNDDAMRFFVEACLPKIREAIPSVTLTIVGRKPYSHLTELSRRDPSIRVTGRVDDVRPFINKASVYIVPIRIGGGTRLKIYEAMAMEMPVVSTSIGAEGLPVRDGHDLLIADSPDAFVTAILRLVDDQNLAARIGQHAAHTVRKRFGWNHVAQRFSELCEKAIVHHCNCSKVSGVDERQSVPCGTGAIQARRQ